MENGYTISNDLVPRIFCLTLKESHGEAALAPSLPASWRAGLLLCIPSGVLWEPVFCASALGPSAFSEASALEAQSVLESRQGCLTVECLVSRP